MTCSKCFLNTTQDHQSRDRTTHSALDPPTLINQDNATLACLWANLMESSSQLMSFFPDDINLCQVDKRNLIITATLEQTQKRHWLSPPFSINYAPTFMEPEFFLEVEKYCMFTQ